MVTKTFSQTLGLLIASQTIFRRRCPPDRLNGRMIVGRLLIVPPIIVVVERLEKGHRRHVSVPEIIDETVDRPETILTLDIRPIQLQNARHLHEKKGSGKSDQSSATLRCETPARAPQALPLAPIP